MKPTWRTFHSIYWESKVSTCFEHYFVILKRRCKNGIWYIACRPPWHPQELFLALIPVRSWVNPRATVGGAGWILLMKNSNDTIGDRTRDLSTRSLVPQPTAPSCSNNFSKWPQWRNQLNTLSLSQLLYCVLILYMFLGVNRPSSGGTTLAVFGVSCVQL
jgi:hypothetical protein